MILFEAIKNMTVEELAKKIAAIATDCDECGGCFDCDGNCISCIEEQLKTDVKQVANQKENSPEAWEQLTLEGFD